MPRPTRAVWGMCPRITASCAVPFGTVSPLLFDVLDVFTALFPFSPALDAIADALDEAGPSIWLPLLHLVAITLAYGALARFALRRFA